MGAHPLHHTHTQSKALRGGVSTPYTTHTHKAKRWMSTWHGLLLRSSSILRKSVISTSIEFGFASCSSAAKRFWKSHSGQKFGISQSQETGPAFCIIEPRSQDWKLSTRFLFFVCCFLFVVCCLFFVFVFVFVFVSHARDARQTT